MDMTRTLILTSQTKKTKTHRRFAATEEVKEGWGKSRTGRAPSRHPQPGRGKGKRHGRRDQQRRRRRGEGWLPAPTASLALPTGHHAAPRGHRPARPQAPAGCGSCGAAGAPPHPPRRTAVAPLSRGHAVARPCLQRAPTPLTTPRHRIRANGEAIMQTCAPGAPCQSPANRLPLATAAGERTAPATRLMRGLADPRMPRGAGAAMGASDAPSCAS